MRIRIGLKELPIDKLILHIDRTAIMQRGILERAGVILNGAEQRSPRRAIQSSAPFGLAQGRLRREISAERWMFVGQVMFNGFLCRGKK